MPVDHGDGLSFAERKAQMQAKSDDMRKRAHVVSSIIIHCNVVLMSSSSLFQTDNPHKGGKKWQVVLSPFLYACVEDVYCLAQCSSNTASPSC